MTRIGLLAALIFSAAAALGGTPRRLPSVAQAPYEGPSDLFEDREFEPPGAEPTRFELGAQFDKGLFLRGADLRRDPFAIYVGARLQLRHTGFLRDEEFFTDQTGATSEILNRNSFESERARLNLNGVGGHPDLTYNIVLDGDSDGASNVDALLYMMTYEADRRLKVRFGRWKVASHREWLLSSRFLQMVDRSLATEFFRVGFSDGVWLLGDVGEAHYEVSLTNGARTATTRPLALDDNLAFAGTVYWDPLGPYGPGHADYAWHETPVVRLGASFVFDKSSDRIDEGEPLGDDNFVRLTDGTLLAATGALAPGVRLTGDRIYEGSIDLSAKHRGWSASFEFFFRTLQDFTADGPLPLSQIDDNGFRIDVGKFLLPQRLDVNGRMSQIGGLFGDAFEYSLGVNYYWGSHRNAEGALDDRVNKWSFDVTEVKGAPVTSTPANFVAGDDGVLFRTQLQWGF